jgi:Zn finger protein HypA/HybF involved in hydrogenase expression
MSWKKKYKCAQCHYEIDVYEGHGMFGQQIEAMSCPDCHTIQNIVYGGIIGDVAPSFSTTAGRLCLKCGSENARKWDGHTCPKCGGEMTETGEKEFWT